MPASVTIDSFLDVIRRSRLVDEAALSKSLEAVAGRELTPEQTAAALVGRGLLTPFQARYLLNGKWRGFVIGGKYKLLDLLGRGGMGVVYVCEHARLRSLVALKMLPPDQLREPATLERFFHEARAAAALNHPNVVRTHDIDQDGNAHFMVMEYVDGCDLQRLVERVGRLPVAHAAHAVAQAAVGLQHAHEHGWVHRDIKPANILLGRRGLVKVSDLGLARLFSDEDGSITKRLEKDTLLGTADYLAPEQSIDSSAVDIRADIYGLGGVLYFLLAGRPPVARGTVTQKLMRLHTQEPDPIRSLWAEVPDELAAVLKRMLAKNPDDRFREPVEVAEALAAWAADAPAVPAEWMPSHGPAVAQLVGENPASNHPRSGGARTTLTPVAALQSTRRRPAPAAADVFVAVQVDGSDYDGNKGMGDCTVNCVNQNEIYSFHVGGANALRADGSVFVLTRKVPPGVIAALVNRNGDEPISSADY